MQHYLGEEGRDRVVLIKSLIYARVERSALGVPYKGSKES